MSEKKFSTFYLVKNPKRPFWNIVGYDSKGKKLLRSSGTTSKKDSELIGQALVDSDWKEIEGRLTKNPSRVPPEAKALIKKLAAKGTSNKKIAKKVYEKFNLDLSPTTITENTGRTKEVSTPEEIDKYLEKHNLQRGGTPKQKRQRKNAHLSRKRIKAGNPEITYSYQDELRNFKKAGLSIDSPEVQKFIEKRTRDKLHSIKSKSKVHSYETVDGEIKADSKKLVANLFEESDEKEIRALVKNVVVEQAENFFKDGKIPDVDDLDHIFPGGSPKIIDGKLVGGAVSPEGDFQGIGLSNRRNFQALQRTLNRSLSNVLTPEKLAPLGIGEFKPSTREGSLARILQLGQSQRGETDASGKPVRKPTARRGVFLSPFPWVGAATLPLWLLASDRAQAMVDEGEEIVSNALPEGLLNFGSKADNAISKTFDMFGANNTASLTPNPMAAMQWLYEGGKQAIPETIGLLNAMIKTPETPEKNLSRLERLRLMQSGRSY
jgi:hypothetical protein